MGIDDDPNDDTPEDPPPPACQVALPDASLVSTYPAVGLVDRRKALVVSVVKPVIVVIEFCVVVAIVPYREEP